MDTLEKRNAIKEYSKNHVHTVKCGCSDGPHFVVDSECTSTHYLNITKSFGILTVETHAKCPKCNYTLRRLYYNGNEIENEITR